MSARRQLVNEGDLVRAVRDIDGGRMPNGEPYRATKGTLLRVEERKGEWLMLVSVKYGARCAGDQGDVQLDSRAKKRASS